MTDSVADESRLRSEACLSAWILARRRLVADCAIDDWPGFVARVRAVRSSLVGGSLNRWGEHELLAAIQLAVRGRGRPADRVVRALLYVAADPVTVGPVEVAGLGPWWHDPATVDDGDVDRLSEMAADLDASDGLRPVVQAEARAQLKAEGLPVTQAGVVRRAHALLTARQHGVGGGGR